MLKVVRKEGRTATYVLNPLLAYKGRLSRRVMAIFSYYDEVGEEKPELLVKFEEQYGLTLGNISDVIERALVDAGLGYISTDPRDLEYL